MFPQISGDHCPMRSISLSSFSEGDCGPDSTWLEISERCFLLVLIGYKTKSYLHQRILPWYYFTRILAGQNHKVMCKAKELGMNFFHNQGFFSEHVFSVQVGHL